MSLLEKAFKSIAEMPETSARRAYAEIDFGKKPASDSTDLERILALPRRPLPSEEEQEAMAAEMTKRLRRENLACECAALRPEVMARGQVPCITELRPVQGWYLREVAENGGAIGFLPVGSGKTGLDVLSPMVFPGCELAVLLLPPDLREQFRADYKVWSQHFQTPNLVGGPGPFYSGRPRLEILAYSELSHETRAHWLATRKPVLILGDEVHALKDRKSTRTGRFLRFCAAHPETRFAGHSGSTTTRGVQDYAHLSALALRERSPLPLDPGTVDEWGDVLNPAKGGFSAPPGALKKLCRPEEPVEDGFARRLLETPGVIASLEQAISIPLIFREADAGAVPENVRKALQSTKRDEILPDGNELVDQFEVAAAARQLSCGFFYRWKYPDGEPEPLILEWFAKRKAWSAELRDKLRRRRDGLDSPKLVRDAAERHWSGYKGPLPTWEAETWPAWRDIRFRVKPQTEAVWVDDWLAQRCVDWAAEAPGIVWFGFKAFGLRVAELGRLPYYGGGDKASAGIRQEDGKRSVVASIKAHHKGKNLQSFWRSLVVPFPSDGGTAEQLSGRTHRPGQPKDRVEVHVFRHTDEMRDALDMANEYARYTHRTTRAPQKLLHARYTWKPDFSTNRTPVDNAEIKMHSDLRRTAAGGGAGR